MNENNELTLEEFTLKVCRLLILRGKPATCVNACEHAIMDIGDLGYRIAKPRKNTCSEKQENWRGKW